MKNILSDESDDDSVNTVLRANILRLAGGRSVQGLRADMAARGFAIGTGTLHRAMQGRSGNVSSLTKIAEFFSISPEQLLQVDLGAESAAWPFSAQLQDRVKGLKEKELLALEVAMWHQLDEEAPADVQNRLRQARSKLEQITEEVQGVPEVTPSRTEIRKV